MAREESVANAYLVSKKKPERQTYQPRSKSQPVRESGVPSPEKPEGGSDAHGDQHHASNGTGTEDQQVDQGPVRISNSGENKQGHGGRTSEAMNDPDHQGT
jgi:hypothetical protein